MATGVDVVQAAQALTGVAARAARDTERRRRLTGDLVAAMVDAGVYRLLVPLEPWRYYELGRVASEPFAGDCLDVSSPKLLASLLQREGRGRWTAVDLLPDEHLVYIGDTGRYPYGPRPQDEVRRFAHQIAWSLVKDHDVKVVVVACNTAGEHAGVPMGGRSAVIDPWGTVLAEAGNEEEVLSVELDTGQVAKARRDFPVLDDRRL